MDTTTPRGKLAVQFEGSVRLNIIEPDGSVGGFAVEAYLPELIRVGVAENEAVALEHGIVAGSWEYEDLTVMIEGEAVETEVALGYATVGLRKVLREAVRRFSEEPGL
jgi:hypothetical protein